MPCRFSPAPGRRSGVSMPASPPTAPPMPFRPVVLPPGARGTLWLHSMPGRIERWDAFVAEAEQVRLGVIVCLTPRHELSALAPAYDAAVRANALPARWLHLPMRDFGLADNVKAFRAGIEALGRDLSGGEAVLLHCAAGIGRTGTAAACLLKCLGLPADDALRRVREAGSNPQSAAQSGLIHSF